MQPTRPHTGKQCAGAWSASDGARGCTASTNQGSNKPAITGILQPFAKARVTARAPQQRAVRMAIIPSPASGRSTRTKYNIIIMLRMLYLVKKYENTHFHEQTHKRTHAHTNAHQARRCRQAARLLSNNHTATSAQLSSAPFHACYHRQSSRQALIAVRISTGGIPARYDTTPTAPS